MLKKYICLLPVLLLFLNADRFFERPSPTIPSIVIDTDNVAPTLPGQDAGPFGSALPLNIVFIGSPPSLVSKLLAAGGSSVPMYWLSSLEAGWEQFFDGAAITAWPPIKCRRLLSRCQTMNFVFPETCSHDSIHMRLWYTGLHDHTNQLVWWASARVDNSNDFTFAREEMRRRLASTPGLNSKLTPVLPQIPQVSIDERGKPISSDGRVLVLTLNPMAQR